MIELIKIGAEWCGPCKTIAPILEKLENEFTEVKFTYLDADNDKIPDKYNVRSIPAVFIEKDGIVVEKFVGIKSELQIKELLMSIH